MEANLSFFSSESQFFGYYTSDGEETEIHYDSDDPYDDYLKFGEKEGFLKKNKDDEYEFIRDTPTPRI